MTIKCFFEDYDGEIVLSDVRNFKDADDFVKQAETYVAETRGFRIPILQPTVTDILVGEEEWKPEDDPDFEGKKITVYCSVIDQENSEETKGESDRWCENRVEAYKHYVKTDMQALEGYENRIKSLQKELQDLEKQKERKMSQVEKQIFQLYNQGWEMKHGVWVEVNKR
ncbi:MULTISPECIES: hypothetical protein [Bacillus cereus group]|uniref:hypothetical protein n=1 Tax=Bacillus cereus group TaxID=86661 RepID=UPI001F56576F|nr:MULTISPECIES: hypothetical protein [unclassified Bacillus cereus group]